MNDFKSIKDELQFIISGEGNASQKNTIKAAQTYLKNSKSSGSQIKGRELSRAEEERALIVFARENNLLINGDSPGTYIAEGAEQKVFFEEEEACVYKKADAVFYISWFDYLNNLLLHNYFFPDTAYSLIGFSLHKQKLFAILKQPYVTSTEPTNLLTVKEFLIAKGFVNKKNNDYYHPHLGLILEDLHDENVLTNSGMLFFVDTVFYLTPEFYMPTPEA